MTPTQPDATLTAYLTTVDGYGDKTLDVIPGDDGSGLAPILTEPVPFDGEDGNGDPVVDMEMVDRILRAHGFRTIRTHIEGVIDQPGHWTLTDFGAVATVVRT